MASLQLRTLHQLHVIDAAVSAIRGRAAGLDPGRTIQGAIKKLEEEHEAKGGEYKALTAELADLELQQKTIEEKLKKIDKEMYGGLIISPREVENLQKEADILKRHRESFDERIMELWELVPPAGEVAAEVAKKIEAKKAELAEHQKKVLEEQARLQQEFKARTAERPAAASKVDPALLTRYESIRQKHDGLGMTTVDKHGACALCGTLLPRKTVEAALEDKIVTCESCHRIIYASEGLL
jgi:predicted  nucleic acid-binding Zn-ribbon protein